MIDVEDICREAKKSSYLIGAMSSEEKNNILKIIGEAIINNIDEILEANKLDIDNLSGRDKTFLDRLTLTEKRIIAMSDGLKDLIAYPDPIGEIVDEWTNRAGLKISKVRAPLGVIAVIYEARPNVTVDVAGLCIKTGNAVVLRGGSDAINSNRALYNVIKNALKMNNYPENIVQFIDDTDRNKTLELLKQGKYIDVVIPRGGNKLKDLVLSNATMPVIASAGGNCHIYVEKSADINSAIKVILNAKTQRPTVCNACEQLLIDKDIIEYAVPEIFKALEENGVVVKADKECQKYYKCEIATEEDYYEEHLGMVLSVKSVNDINEAIDRINTHSTSHSEAIISEDKCAIDKFVKEVDSGCLYVNASTRFTDGFEFGFGAEIGISTQKLHARGPLGARQLTSEKYVVVGNGTIRE